MEAQVDVRRAPAAEPPRPARWPELALKVSIGVALALAAASIVIADRAWLVLHVSDDSYYYLEIGRRIAEGDGATFDGIHRTNGFHPLWQAVVATLALVFDGAVLVKSVLLVGLACLVGALAAVRSLLRSSVGELPALTGVALLVHSPGLLLRLNNGMETPLVLLGLAMLLLAIRRLAERARWSWVLLGMALGFLVLSRIDYLLLMPLVGVVLLAGTRDLRGVVTTAGVAGAVVAPYFLWNILAFGHLVTVSGTVKLDIMAAVAADKGGRWSGGYWRYAADATNATIDRAFALATPLPGRLSVFGAVVSVAWIVAAVVGYRHIRARGGRLSASGTAITAVVALILAKSAIDHAVLPVWAGTWYAGPLYATFALGLGVGLGRTLVLAAERWDAPAVLWLAVLASVPMTGAMLEPEELDGRHVRAAYALAMPEVASLPPDLVVGAYDAGLVGFELHPRPVVNLDGLVNDFDHAAALAAGTDAADLALDAGVDVVVGRFPEGDPRLPACSTVLWESPYRAAYRDTIGDGAIIEGPVVIASLRTC